MKGTHTMTRAHMWSPDHAKRSFGISRPAMFINLLLGLALTGLTGCDYPTSGTLIGAEEATDETRGDDIANGFIDAELNPLDDFSLPPDYQPAISQEEAKQIAMQDLDPRFYQATSTLFGPMEWLGDVIAAYEVTVQGSDHFLLRYVEAEMGEFLYDEWIELPNTDESVAPTGEPSETQERAYYTSCPAGWPLCIRNPAQITFYSQRDSTWKNDLLGYSSYYTIGSDGCLLSAYAMALKQTGHGNRNPRQLNNNGKSWGCFSGPYIVSGCIASHTGASYNGNLGVNQVWGTIAAGIPVVAYGYSTCLGSNHAQMIWGHDGSRYWTKDPWHDWSNQDQAMCVNNPSFRVMQ